MDTRFADKSILFVDDDDRWLRLIGQWFADTPYKIRMAASGIEALAAIDKEPFDVVVSDISMPVLTGGELMSRVRHKLPNAVRMVMSGQLDVVNSIEAINKGAVFQYIVKPCDAKTMKLAVYQALLVVEQNERDSQRRLEIRRKNTHRIKAMAKSIRDLEQIVDATYDGLLAVVQELAIPTASQRHDATRTVEVLRRLMSRVELLPGFKKQMEVVAVFLHMVCLVEREVELSDCGKLTRGSFGVEDEVLAVRALDILDELNFGTAYEVLQKFIAADPMPAASFQGAESQAALGYALLWLAHDVSKMIENEEISEDEALVTVFRNSTQYGDELVAELLHADIDRIEH